MSSRIRRTILAFVIAVAGAGCLRGQEGAVAPNASVPDRPTRSSASVYVDPDVRRMGDAAGTDVEAIVRTTLEDLAQQLPGDQVQLRVRSDPDDRTGVVIGELGLGGQVRWPSRQIEIAVDTDHGGDPAVMFERWLPRVLAHELHHHRRYGAVERPVHTLLDALVTDGLAMAFAEEAIPDAPPAPWATALSPEQQARWWAEAEQHLTDPLTRADAERWFFGSEEVPRWTGYTLGASLVAGYLDATGTTAADAVGVPARRVLDESPYDPGS